jgi:extradiol dioxygenase family protein
VIPAEDLTIKANHLFFYYKDLGRAQNFYEHTLGLKRVLDYGFATIHQISPTTYIGLVDEARGIHKGSEPKTVTLSFITEEIDGWYRYLNSKGVNNHRPLGDSTQHPTRGFVAYDPEGYFLEFETFLQHEQNKQLKHHLDKNKAIYPQKDMGLKLLTDQGFAKVYASSDTGFIGLVDEAHGLHTFSDVKSVTVCFITDDVKNWFRHLKDECVKFHTPSVRIESEAVEIFVATDVGGYSLEFDRFLDHEKNRDILNAFKNKGTNP